MNKKFATFFSGYNMTVNGNFAYGIINGYETNATVVMLDNIAPLKMHVSFYATAEQKRSIETAIRNLALKFFVMQFSPYGLTLGFNDITVNRLLKRLPSVLDTIYTILSDNGALKSEYCPVCGNLLDETNSKKCNIEGYGITIDNDCVNTINTVISAENQDFNEAPNNYLKGFLGALIGGLAGAAISIALYLVGFISSISAAVSIILGSFLYQKFHGKPNKVMIIIVSLTTVVLMAVSVLAIYVVAAGIAAASEGLSMSAFEAFSICMQDGEFSRLFYCDLAFILLFSALGIGWEIFMLSKKIKRKRNI